LLLRAAADGQADVAAVRQHDGLSIGGADQIVERQALRPRHQEEKARDSGKSRA
jgi:hypothetical protein